MNLGISEEEGYPLCINYLITEVLPNIVSELTSLLSISYFV